MMSMVEALSSPAGLVAAHMYSPWSPSWTWEMARENGFTTKRPSDSSCTSPLCVCVYVCVCVCVCMCVYICMCMCVREKTDLRLS